MIFLGSLWLCYSKHLPFLWLADFALMPELLNGSQCRQITTVADLSTAAGMVPIQTMNARRGG
jgi:hypothetical protein